MTFQSLLFLALFVEGTAQWLKKEYRNVFTYVALALGTLVAWAARADLLVLAGFENPVPYVGYLMTGIVFARGASVLNDLFTWLAKLRAAA
ncbi:MAG: hypothetical protein ACUVTQ_06010 [Desulfotomaculales bacterium]